MNQTFQCIIFEYLKEFSLKGLASSMSINKLLNKQINNGFVIHFSETSDDGKQSDNE